MREGPGQQTDLFFGSPSWSRFDALQNKREREKKSILLSIAFCCVVWFEASPLRYSRPLSTDFAAASRRNYSLSVSAEAARREGRFPAFPVAKSSMGRVKVEREREEKGGGQHRREAHKE